MGTYCVCIARPEYREFWHEYNDGGTVSKKAEEIAKDGSLGQTLVIDARNRADAEQEAREQRPGWVVIGTTHKIG